MTIFILEKVYILWKSVIYKGIKSPKLSVLLFLLVFTLSACEDFVEIGLPTTEVTDESVFTDDITAESALLGIYGDMIGLGSGFSDGWTQSVTFLCGLSADELVYINTIEGLIDINENVIKPANTDIRSGLWTSPYEIIYRVNSLLDGLVAANGISAPKKDQLVGEAKFLRAFAYFFLVNLFGDVPLITSTSIEVTQFAARQPTEEVYDLIIEDLFDAKDLLAVDYPTSGRVRPNKSVVSAFLARVHLYVEDWSSAEAEASEVIANAAYFLESDLNSVFLATSNEAIWQLIPNSQGLNTNEGFQFTLSLYPPNPIGGSILNDDLANAFEVDDSRRSSWVGSVTDGINEAFFANKYKVQFNSTVTEYSMVLRLAEQYLIRAEARARLNNISGAQDDLNLIRTRAGLTNTTAADPDALVLAIEQERRFELFTEWGHRWLDLKRFGRADAVLSPVKTLWQPTAVLYPIPAVDIQNNPNLLPQNEGYQ